MGHTTSAQHYSDLQLFYKKLSVDSSIHLPLWLDGTRSLAEANRNAQVLMARVSRPCAGQRILDAGCGLGGTSIWLAREFGVHVVGISNSASNVEACRRAAAELGTASLTTFQTADLNGDFAAPRSFDAVWSLESLNYLNPKRTFIERVSRALKPGGRWLCMDRYLDPSRLLADDPCLRTLTGGFYAEATWEPAHALKESMSLAGFKETQYQDLTDAVVAVPRGRRVSPSSVVEAAVAVVLHPRSFPAMLRAFRIIRASYSLLQRQHMSYGLLSGRRPEESGEAIHG